MYMIHWASKVLRNTILWDSLYRWSNMWCWVIFCFPIEGLRIIFFRTCLVAQMVKCLPMMWETWVRSLSCWQDPLEKEMATHSSTLAWKIPWMEEPGRLQSTGLQRVRHDWATSLSLFTFMHWRRRWQPTPVFLPGESQGWGSLVGCHLWGRIFKTMLC